MVSFWSYILSWEFQSFVSIGLQFWSTWTTTSSTFDFRYFHQKLLSWLLDEVQCWDTISELLGLVILKCLWYIIMIFWNAIWRDFDLYYEVLFNWRVLLLRLTWINFWSHISLVNFVLHYCSAREMILSSLWSHFDHFEVLISTLCCWESCFFAYMCSCNIWF